ncbi:DUF2637 domain-containing protein [Streptomyces sp. NPDC003036]|uniref:DUF2637 domain-containing protein n=1 Tax=Streptomyces sp. NPDC003036 TaxID=3154442 RepID=UPI0033ACB432
MTEETTEQTADRYALVAAGTVITVLTVAGFWLSYAHLAEVAGRHGLANSPSRQWAWPATLDAFIVAGELLMLRAGLRRVTDWWAVGVTVTGSVGSIALNVFGVSGTAPGPVPLLDYVVAAVPPTGAMLAFGVLMRQIHQRVARPLPDTDEADREGTPEPAVRSAAGSADADHAAPEPGPDPDHAAPEPGPDPDHATPEPGPDPDHATPEPGPSGSPSRTSAPSGPERSGPRRGRPGPARPRTVRAKVQAGRRPQPGPRRLSEDEVVELVLPHVPEVLREDNNKQITRAQLRTIMRRRGITLGNEHLGPVLARVRAATAPSSSEGAVR